MGYDIYYGLICSWLRLGIILTSSFLFCFVSYSSSQTETTESNQTGLKHLIPNQIRGFIGKTKQNKSQIYELPNNFLSFRILAYWSYAIQRQQNRCKFFIRNFSSLHYTKTLLYQQIEEEQRSDTESHFRLFMIQI